MANKQFLLPIRSYHQRRFSLFFFCLLFFFLLQSSIYDFLKKKFTQIAIKNQPTSLLFNPFPESFNTPFIFIIIQFGIITFSGGFLSMITMKECAGGCSITTQTCTARNPLLSVAAKHFKPRRMRIIEVLFSPSSFHRRST